MNTHPSGNTIFINDMDIYYEIHGEGEPLLILHGFTGSGAGLAALFNDFTKQYQLIIPDLRGHGRSTNPSEKYTFNQSALDVFALLKHLGINRCSAIGFSGGGCTLLHMAYQQPDKILAMTIVSAAPYFPQSTLNIMRQSTEENRTKEDWEAMQKIHVHGDKQIKMIWSYLYEFSQSHDMDFTPEKLAQIKTKTLIVQGDRDPFYPIELTIEMYKRMPNAYLWVVPNGGHGAVSNDRMSEFIENVDKFLLL